MMSVMSTTTQVAPGRLELVREFVNSLDVDDDTDQLDAASAADWLAARGLPGGNQALTDDDRERLISLREALRSLLDANNAGEPPPAESLETLNRQASDAALGLRFDAEGAELVSTCGGVDSAIAELLAIVHETMRDGSWSRLKLCPADDCRWAFYDRSRNRSGTWCDMGVCGNRAKARAFRERRHADSGR